MKIKLKEGWSQTLVISAIATAFLNLGCEILAVSLQSHPMTFVDAYIYLEGPIVLAVGAFLLALAGVVLEPGKRLGKLALTLSVGVALITALLRAFPH